MKSRLQLWFTKNLALKVMVILLAIFAVGFSGYHIAKAEIGTGTPESGVVSHIKTLYTDLTGLTFGLDTDTPDWGAYWNRIKTAAKWTPTVTSTVTDVKTGKTFVSNGSRTNSTGTYPAPGPCSTQAYHDSYGAGATETTNCTNTITWTANPIPATGDDALAGRGGYDPRTGLTWSQLLLNSAGTVTFSAASNSAWSWDASAAANVAVGNKTAKQICSDRGNGWRLPTQKELMQAYIDGSNFNLTQPGSAFWSATESSATSAWNVYLYNGTTNANAKTNSFQVRCVR